MSAAYRVIFVRLSLNVVRLNHGGEHRKTVAHVHGPVKIVAVDASELNLVSRLVRHKEGMGGGERERERRRRYTYEGTAFFLQRPDATAAPR